MNVLSLKSYCLVNLSVCLIVNVSLSSYVSGCDYHEPFYYDGNEYKKLVKQEIKTYIYESEGGSPDSSNSDIINQSYKESIHDTFLAPPNCGPLEWKVEYGVHNRDQITHFPPSDPYWYKLHYAFDNLDNQGWVCYDPQSPPCSWYDSYSSGGSISEPWPLPGSFGDYQNWDYELVESTSTKKHERWTKVHNNNYNDGYSWQDTEIKWIFEIIWEYSEPIQCDL